MTDWHAKTLQTYNDSATEMAEYFKGIGSRKLYIDLAFKLRGNEENTKVVEIGCGDGRDAAEIVKLTKDYIGFDPSESMIRLAKQKLPQASFEVADALTLKYPKNVDIVFAFASLLHVNSSDLKKVLAKIYESLSPRGLAYLSLKESPQYREEPKTDRFGERMFYYYSVKDILDLADNKFEPVLEIHETIGSTQWFELGLRAKN